MSAGSCRREEGAIAGGEMRGGPLFEISPRLETKVYLESFQFQEPGTWLQISVAVKKLAAGAGQIPSLFEDEFRPACGLKMQNTHAEAAEDQCRK